MDCQTDRWNENSCQNFVVAVAVVVVVVVVDVDVIVVVVTKSKKTKFFDNVKLFNVTYK